MMMVFETGTAIYERRRQQKGNPASAFVTSITFQLRFLFPFLPHFRNRRLVVGYVRAWDYTTVHNRGGGGGEEFQTFP